MDVSPPRDEPAWLILRCSKHASARSRERGRERNLSRAVCNQSLHPSQTPLPRTRSVCGDAEATGAREERAMSDDATMHGSQKQTLKTARCLRVPVLDEDETIIKSNAKSVGQQVVMTPGRA